MRIVLFLFVMSLCNGLISQAPPWQWADEANSSGVEYAWDVACDTNSASVYIGGTFDTNLSAQYGPAFTASYGQDDGFLAKYTNAGVFQWAIKMGGSTSDQVKGVAVDPSGNVYVGGYFTGTADFDPSASTFTLTSVGAKDGFLAKYSSSGVFLWAVKYGGTGDDEPWKMYADGNGIYLTGSYANVPATFNSYSSGVTKTTTSTNTNGEVFGVKYNSSGIAQWVISGGGSKIDCGYSIVADANNAYFIGRYDDNITFKNSTGVASGVLQAQQSNKQQVFIIAYTQSAGNFVWQNNITCNQGGDDVVGWTIAQDASNLYVSGYLQNDINFKYPSPTLTQTLTSGGNFDIFLAQLSKTGTFNWRTAVTGSGAGEQVGRAVEVDHAGNVILSGYFMNNLDYSAVGGPVLTASAKDIFVASYSNTGAFQWAAKAGNTGDDLVNGLSVDNSGGIYVTGSDDNGAVFGTYSLTAGGGVNNIYVAKIGCNALGNNTITANQTICAGNAPSSLTGSMPTGSGPYTYVWEQSLNNSTWANAAGTYTNQNYAPPALTVSTYFRRTVNVTGNCTNTLSSASILITVMQAPTVSNAGTTQTLCTSSATLNANTPAVGTGIWSVITGTASVTAPALANTGVTGLSNGTNKFVWTISNGVCPSSTSTVTIMRDVPPTASNAGTTQTLCASSATLNANTPAIGTGAWSVITGTGSVSNTTLSNSAVTGLSTGTNQFVWTTSNGTCPASTSTVTVMRDIPPTISSAGSAQTLCTSSATLNANSPTIGTGLWTVFTGTGSVTSPALANSAVTGLSNGTNKFVWTISNGTCPSSTSTVTVVKDIPPTVSNAGITQTLCASTATLNANAPTTGTGIWTVFTGTGSVTSPAFSGSAVTGLSNGINQFVWTISNGTCPSSTSTVTIMRDVPPTTSNAGITQTLCTNAATLNANAPTIGTGIWTVFTGTGSVTSPASSGSPVTGLSNGTNQFVWTISNGTCPTSTSTVTIMRDIPPTTSNAGITQTLCASTATLNANAPTTGTGIWSVVTGTGSVTSPASSGSPVTGLSNGTNQFVWTISNGTCPSSTSTVTITRDIPPTLSNAGPTQTLCTNTATLNANVPITGTGLWTVVTGTGSVTNVISAVSPVTGLSNGTNQFAWTISNGTCPASTSTVTVMREIPPTISDAGLTQTLCTSNATLNANTPSTGTGVWSVSSGTASVSNSSLPNSNVTGLSNGTNQFIWTISNGTCPSSTSTVTIIRDLPPTVSIAGTTQTVCTNNATLNANTPSTGTGVWSVSSGTASVSNPSLPNSNITGLSNGTNQFIWTISNGTCPSSTSTVTISRDVSPSISNAGPSQTICASSATLNANTPVTGTGIWLLVSGSASITSSSSPTTGITGLSAGVNQFAWTISNGVCPSSSSTVTINKDLPPTSSLAGTSQTVCNATASLNANTPLTGTGMWAAISGNASFSQVNNPSTSASLLSVGQNIFSWTISNGVCAPSTSTVSVYVQQMPSPANAGSDVAVCSATAALNATAPVIGTGLWSVFSGTGNIILINSSTTAVTNLSTGQNVFVWSVTNGMCPVNSDTVIIKRDALPTAANAGADQLICASNYTLNANVPLTGTGQWSSLSGNHFSASSAATTTVTGLNTGNNILLWSITNGSCAASIDTVLIKVDAEPSVAFAGDDRHICSDNLMLSATDPSTGLGVWSLVSGTGVILNPGQYNSALSSLSSGTVVLRWTTHNGVCADKTDDVVIVRDLLPDTAKAGPDQSTDNPITKLAANNPVIGTGHWSVIEGTPVIENSYSFNTNANLSEGNNVFRWTIENGVCPSNYDDILVYAKPLAIPNAFSPNGDGVNDLFVIPGIEYYNDVQFTVFNRWGASIYTDANYKNTWAGVNTGNEVIAEDTYYYTLQMNTGKTYTGFIIVKRGK